MKRPLFLLMIGLVLGEAAAINRAVFGLVAVIWLSGAVILAGMRHKKWYYRRFFRLFRVCPERTIQVILLLLMVSVAVGDLHGSFSKIRRERDPAGRALAEAGGEIDGEMEAVVAQRKHTASGSWNLTLKQGGVFQGKAGPFVCRYRCTLYIKKFSAGSVPEIGDRIACEGTFYELEAPTNPGQFDSRRYNRARGIGYQMRAELVSIAEPGKPGFRKAAALLRERISVVYEKCLPSREAGLLKAMVLGDKSDLSEEERRMYEECGVAHLLAVSGLHVSIVSGRVFRFFRRRRFRYPSACILGALVLWFYGCMTGFGSSVIRAGMMFGCYLLAQLIGAEYDLISAMSLAGIVMLLENPAYLTDPGWLISFCCIGSIGLVLPFMRELRKRRNEKTMVQGELSFGGEQIRHLRERIFDSTVLALSTGPVVAFFYYEWSWCSIFLNLVAIPAMAPLLLSAIAGGVFGWISPFAGTFACLPARGILLFFHGLFQAALSLPGTPLVIGALTVPKLMVLFAAEVLGILFWYQRAYPKMLALFALAFGCCIFLQDTGLRVTVLDVGQGDCILLQMPDSRTILIDCGSTTREKIGQYVVRPALKYYGIRHLDDVILTHPDLDHISGISELLEEGYPVRRLILPAADASEGFETILELADKNRTAVETVRRGDQKVIAWVNVTCLNPGRAETVSDVNDLSVVLYLSYGQFDALFTGDIGEVPETEMVECFKKYPEQFPGLSDGVTCLKVAHHGSRYSSTKDFLSCVRPANALISVGAGNWYGHPTQETLSRLHQAGASILRTDQDGAIEVKTDGRMYRIRTFLR